MAKDVNSDLTNLMDLLDEQDESLFEKIGETIISYGVKAIPFLENISENSLDDLVQSRALTLISKIRIHNLYSELHNWATLDSKDLLKGYFIISKYLFPDVEEKSVMAKVEALKKEVWLELKKGMTPFEELTVISKIFFEVRKFSFNGNASSIPDCLCLNAVLNTGKGHPDSFAMLYTGIAQRLGIPVYGSCLKENMFLTYVYSGDSLELDLRNDVKFYINPMCAGLFFPLTVIKKELEEDHPDEIEIFSGACTNAKFIYKLLNVFKQHYTKKMRPDKAEDIKVLMSALGIE